MKTAEEEGASHMRGVPFAELSSCRRRMHYGTFMAAIEREASVEENGRKMGIRCFETQLLNNRRRSAFNHHLSSLFLYVCVCVTPLEEVDKENLTARGNV